jgi:hypothetical protein
MDAISIISTALQIGSAAVPLVPEIQALFTLASSLVTENRQPTDEEVAQLQTSVDTAHKQAQAALAAAAAAQQQAQADAAAAQARITALAPVASALGATQSA